MWIPHHKEISTTSCYSVENVTSIGVTLTTIAFGKAVVCPAFDQSDLCGFDFVKTGGLFLKGVTKAAIAG